MTIKYLSAKVPDSALDAPEGSSGEGHPPSNPISPSFDSTAPAPRLTKIKETSKLLGCSPVTVRRRVKDGSLPHYRIHGRLLFDLRQLRLYLERHRVDPAEMITNVAK
jgi:excisionase family DNA binding protein